MSMLEKSTLSARVAGLPEQKSQPLKPRALWAFLRTNTWRAEEKDEEDIGDLPPEVTEFRYLV